jgi:hypothetical protein
VFTSGGNACHCNGMVRAPLTANSGLFRRRSSRFELIRDEPCAIHS